MASSKKQIHVWLPQDMLDEIDEFAAARGISRSAAVAVLLAEGLGRNGGGAR